jgi:hypothetical protein
MHILQPTSLAKRRDENIADAFAQIELNCKTKPSSVLLA